MLLKKKDTVYFFFSGKGGVGKTSIAAASALWFSRNRKKTLIISTDPAHSLSDSFKINIGGDIKRIDKNLFAVEIEPKKAMEEYKEKFSPEIEKIGMLKGMGIGDIFDTAGMTPGIDEVAAFDKFLSYMNSREYDVIIFDTAPTGHALRFLSLPEVIDSWLGKMIKLRLKFSGFVNVFKKMMPFGSDKEEPSIGTDFLEEMKQRIKSAREILSDPKKTHYNLVIIPEDMSILETERSLKVMAEYNIPVETVIVNKLIPENMECKFCSAKRKQQQEKVSVINKKFNRFRILNLPLFEREIRGLEALQAVSQKLYGNN